MSKIIKYVSAHNIDFVVRGGGHSTGGNSSTLGGVVIDLGNHRPITVDTTAKTVRVGGGARWSDVDDALWAHGLATVGGTVGDTGIGGLTLGGGYGWLSGNHGLVIDNLLSCEVVLGDGQIVRASATEYPDLFWALRGAGQNFGVVTEFEYQAWDQRPMYAGLAAFSLDKTKQVVDAFNALDVTDGKLNIMLGIAKPPPAAGHVVIMACLTYDSPDAAEAEAALAPLLSLGPLFSTCAVMPYNMVNRMLPAEEYTRASTKGSSYMRPLRPEFMDAMVQDYSRFTDEVPDASHALILLELRNMEATMKVGNADMAFANRGEYLNLLVISKWEGAENDAACRAWPREFVKICDREKEAAFKAQHVEGQGVGLYGNYDRESPFLIMLVASSFPLSLLLIPCFGNG